MLIASIQVGLPRVGVSPGAPDQPWVSGIFKTPIAGDVFVGETQIDGDGQADLRVHGGPDKAVLAYSLDHYPTWRAELDLPDLSPGAFGENLSVTGGTEHDVYIGDLWQARNVLFEVSQPREPCWKLAAKLERKTLPARVAATGKGGWYLRVRSTGVIAAGDELKLTARPNPRWPIARMNEILYGRLRDEPALNDLAPVAALTNGWRRLIRSRLDDR